MSLRKRLLFILGGTFAVLWAAAAMWLLGDLRHELERVLDERLSSSANMVAGLLEQMPQPVLGSAMSPFDTQMLGLRRGMVCQVRTLRGEVIVRTPNMLFAEPEDELLGFSTTHVDQQAWRTYTVQRGHLLITIGDQLDEREHLQRVILLAAGLPVLLALLGSLLLIWLGIGRGLAPLDQLRLQLAQRQADELAPLSEHQVPKELQPLFATLNQLLGRLRALLERERRFNDDAAHELRTPLTAIKTHLQVAKLAEPELAQLSLDSAQCAVERMQSTMEQLLLLARLDSQDDFSELPPSSAQSIARGTLDAMLAHPEFSRIQVCSDLQRECTLAVPEPLATVALRNLLDNALKYSPAGSAIELTIFLREEHVVFRVEDQGEGLSAADFADAQQRFWRARASHEGSGLGLAIVSSICQRFQGQLSTTQLPHGFRVELVFPVNCV